MKTLPRPAMPRRLSFWVAAYFVLMPLRAQTPSASASEGDAVIRVTVNLVQVDAVVTDKEDQLVTNLTAEDFEILQDKQSQQIRNFSFVSIASGSTTGRDAATAGELRPEGTVQRSPTALRVDQVKRTIAFVVDDLGLSWESMRGVRDALGKFIDEQMQLNDLVAILRTGGGIGALQSFTSDKRQLRAAVGRLKWNPLGRGGVDAFSMPDDLSGYPDGQGSDLPPGATQDMMNTQRLDILRGEVRNRSEAGGMGSEVSESREKYFLVGTLGALGHIVQGLETLPGRKSVVLLSDSIGVLAAEGKSKRVLDGLRRVTELANRASVVLYTIDPRGVQHLGVTAATSLTESDPFLVANSRKLEYFEGQSGLGFLAYETGGLFVASTNEVSGAIGRVMDDQKGYYLIGYRPPEETFDRRFHKIEVRVKQPGLRVRSRSGFAGVADKAPEPKQTDRLLAALTSPFGADEVRLKLTGLFANDDKGSFINCLLHINGGDLTFLREEEQTHTGAGERERTYGRHKALVNVAVMTFGDNGKIVEQSRQSFAIRRTTKARQHAEQGLVYSVSHPVRKAGAYQVRAAVLDTSSGKMGSASQFIEIPKVDKGGLAVSGIYLRARPSKKQEKGEETPALEILSSPAMRVFRPGEQLEYKFQIVNAKVDRIGKRPQLEARMRVLHEAKTVFETESLALNLQPQKDWKHVFYGGLMKLADDLKPGDYILQFLVTDKLRKEQRPAVQWTDFEIRAPRLAALPQGVATTGRTDLPRKPLPAGLAPPQVEFRDLSQEAGLTGVNVVGVRARKDYLVESAGTGVAVFDYDNDGLQDIFLVNGDLFDRGSLRPRHHLYRNTGELKFVDVTKEAGLVHTGWGQGVCAGDIDNDAHTDLLVTHWGQHRLFRNQGDGTFRDETARRGLAVPQRRWSTGCSFLDYDRDGDLDLFVANYVDFDPEKIPKAGEPPRPGQIAECNWKGIAVFCGPRGLPAETMSFYENDGNGVFTDVSEKAGISGPKTYYGFTTLTGDFDDDGWPDVYVACDSTPSLLYRNLGDGTFEDLGTVSGAAYNIDGMEQAGMGATAADYDGDGDLDIFKTNFSGDTHTLYRNDGDWTFMDETIPAGLAVNTRYLGWGAAFTDVDHDGWKDIFVANGHIYPEVDDSKINETFLQRRLLYWNRGDGQFHDVSPEAGPAIAARHSSRGIAIGDLDNDGTLEIVVANMHEPPSLLKNFGERGNSLLVEALTSSGRDAIGARVKVVSGELKQIDEVRSGGYHISQSDFRVHFGMGTNTRADIKVRWPDGKEDTFESVEVNQWVTIQQGKGLIETHKFR